MLQKKVGSPLRRAQDDCCLRLIDALDSGTASVENVIIPLFKQASLPLPLNFSMDPRTMLLQRIQNAGAAVARSIAATADSSGDSESRAEGLSQNIQFRLFCALKLQAMEGSLVRY